MPPQTGRHAGGVACLWARPHPRHQPHTLPAHAPCSGCRGRGGTHAQAGKTPGGRISSWDSQGCCSSHNRKRDGISDEDLGLCGMSNPVCAGKHNRCEADPYLYASSFCRSCLRKLSDRRRGRPSAPRSTLHSVRVRCVTWPRPDPSSSSCGRYNRHSRSHGSIDTASEMQGFLLSLLQPGLFLMAPTWCKVAPAPTSVVTAQGVAAMLDEEG